MPARRSGWLRATLLLTALAGLCGLASGAALIALSMRQGLPAVGEADPSLDPLSRLGLGGYLLLHTAELNGPAGDSQVELELLVEEGATAGQVVEQLVSAGVVGDGSLLLRYMRYRGIDVSIQAGSYALSGDMTPIQLAEALQRAGSPSTTLTVPEGFRREQIAELVERLELDFGGMDFFHATQSLGVDGLPGMGIPAGANLEGFLFPDTYQVDPHGRAEELVAAMLANFAAKVDGSMRSSFEAQRLSVYQAVTLASIVEREAVLAGERPLIAAVFLNRLRLEMPLEADPTVQYALGLQADGAWWKRGLTSSDLGFDSPYNTYRYPGLPPGPIANPGLSSLQAVAAPPTTQLLYFRAACDGSGAHVFAETFEEHLQNACP